MSQIYGNIAEFLFEGDCIVEWFERLEQWFIANGIEEGNRKRALLLSFIGARGYKLLRSLAQNEPTGKVYDELKKLMVDHLNPKPNEIAQRYVFYKRDRRNGESIKDYIAELRKLSEHCNFASTQLEENLRDKFVCGLNDEKIQQKLLATSNLSLKIAIDTAVAMEAAIKSARQIHHSGVDVHKLVGGSHLGWKGKGNNNSSSNQNGKECYRCGSGRHLADRCPFKTQECFNCKQVGHTKRKCRSGSSISVNKRNNARIHFEEIENIDEQLDDDQQVVEQGMYCLNLYKLGNEERFRNPVMVSLGLNGVEVKMEVDTGAAVSVISNDLYSRIRGEPLVKSGLKLKTYTGEMVIPRGVGMVGVNYGIQNFRLPITVVDGKVPALLGRDWLNHLKLDWNALFGTNKLGKELDSEETVVTSTVMEDIRTKGQLFEEIKRHCPEVVEKCMKLWSKDQQTGVKVHMDDLREIFPEVFSDKLGKLKDMKVHIPIPVGTKPKYFKPRPVPYALRQRLDEELEKLERQNVWKKVKFSKWAAPIVIVLKNAKDPAGPIRICGDYKVTVNSVAPCDNYPIPSTSEQLATLKGGKKFSKIDLSQAYQQLELDDESKELLTVSTHKGLYQPDRLQFGIHSATGIFQREMERILAGIPCVLVRVDDILVTGKDDWEHFWVLMRVLCALAEAGFTCNLKKCAFFRDEITFCGYKISREGVKPLSENVEAVLKAPEPKNVTELKSFLGMVNYYQNYLQSLSSISEPLHQLLRKGVVWNWGEEQSRVFGVIKKMLSESPLLVHFDPSLPIVVHTDASPYGLGGVMSHVFPDGKEKPVCYISRSLSVAERNYGHIEKEGLGLVFAVKKLHHFLFGHKFLMITDHKPLLGLFGENKGIPDRAAARIARWALLLSAYDYKLEYRPGPLNANADALSRLPLEALEGDVSQSCVGVHMMELLSSPVTEEEVRKETSNDPILSVVRGNVLHGWAMKAVADNIKPFFKIKDELTVDSDCVLWGNRVIIPEKLRETILSELHDVHPGVTRMKALARSFVWWPGMDKDIELLVKNCHTCCVNQSSPVSAPVHPWENPKQPWERLHLDFAGPYMGKMFLILVDAYSKWIEVEIMNSITSLSTVSKLRRIFSMHGLPKTVVTDNGAAFVGHEYVEFLKKNGIKQVRTAPYHPSSNGQAERYVRTFKEAMKSLATGDVETKLNRMLFKYRVMPHSTTGSSPAELMFNRQLRSPFHLLQPSNGYREEPNSSTTGLRKFKEGDRVWAKNFGKGERWLAGVVTKSLGKVNYMVKLVNFPNMVHRHIDQLVLRVKEVEQVDSTYFDFDVGTPLLMECTGSEQECIGKEVIEKKNTEQEVTENLSHETNLRRSNRQSKKPAWTREFVSK